MEAPGLLRSRLGLRGLVWLVTAIVTLAWVGWNDHPDDLLTGLLCWLGGLATWACITEARNIRHR